MGVKIWIEGVESNTFKERIPVFFFFLIVHELFSIKYSVVARE